MAAIDFLPLFSVKVNQGSGCLVQPPEVDFTYVFTARHVVKNEEDEKPVVIRQHLKDGTIDEELITVLDVFYHPNPLIDAAILKVEKVEDIANLNMAKAELGSLHECHLIGHPATRRGEGKYSFRSNQISAFINHQINNYIEASLNPVIIRTEVVGQSGGGIIIIYADQLLLAGIQSEMSASDDESIGRINFMPLHLFNEIISQEGLPMLKNPVPYKTPDNPGAVNRNQTAPNLNVVIQNLPAKRIIQKKYHASAYNTSKHFVISIKDNHSFQLSHSGMELATLDINHTINDVLCKNTITYCYDTIRGSGENLRQNTRNNLSTLIGSYLFKILLEKHAQSLIEAIQTNNSKPLNEREDLQLILNFEDTEEASKLSNWPWEYLYYTNANHPNDKYFLHTKFKIYRIANSQAASTTQSIPETNTIRVMLFFAPMKNEYEDSHIKAMEEMFASLINDYGHVKNEKGEIVSLGNIECLMLCPPKIADKGAVEVQTTYANFLMTLSTFKPGIVHFIGEAFDGNAGSDAGLYFWKKDQNEGITEGISLDQDFFDEIGRYIQYVCPETIFIMQSWMNNSENTYRIFKNISDTFISKNAEAVLSIPSRMHIKGTDNLTDYLNAMKKFYGLMAEGNTLGMALSEFRKELIGQGKGYPVAYFSDLQSEQFRIHNDLQDDDHLTTTNELDKFESRPNTQATIR